MRTEPQQIVIQVRYTYLGAIYIRKRIDFKKKFVEQ